MNGPIGRLEIWNTSRDCSLPLFFLPLSVQVQIIKTSGSCLLLFNVLNPRLPQTWIALTKDLKNTLKFHNIKTPLNIKTLDDDRLRNLAANNDLWREEVARKEHETDLSVSGSQQAPRTFQLNIQHFLLSIHVFGFGFLTI